MPILVSASSNAFSITANAVFISVQNLSGNAIIVFAVVTWETVAVWMSVWHCCIASITPSLAANVFVSVKYLSDTLLLSVENFVIAVFNLVNASVFCCAVSVEFERTLLVYFWKRRMSFIVWKIFALFSRILWTAGGSLNETDRQALINPV